MSVQSWERAGLYLHALTWINFREQVSGQMILPLIKYKIFLNEGKTDLAAPCLPCSRAVSVWSDASLFLPLVRRNDLYRDLCLSSRQNEARGLILSGSGRKQSLPAHSSNPRNCLLSRRLWFYLQNEYHQLQDEKWVGRWTYDIASPPRPPHASSTVFVSV